MNRQIINPPRATSVALFFFPLSAFDIFRRSIAFLLDSWYNIRVINHLEESESYEKKI